MPILVDHSSRVIYQGTLEEEDLFDLQQCLAYGTKIVALVGEGKQEVLGLPVFPTVAQAKKQTNGNVSWIRKHPQDIADSILEAEDSSVELIICMGLNPPVHDMREVRRILKKHGKSRLLGPASFGAITPDQTKVGAMPAYIFSSGPVGVISTSASLAYEVAWQMTQAGVGISTCVGTGDEQVEEIDGIVQLFEQDRGTEIILVIGHQCTKRRKPMLAYVQKEHRKTVHKAGVEAIENISTIGEQLCSLCAKVRGTKYS